MVYIAACIVLPIAWGAIVHLVLSRWPTKPRMAEACEANDESSPMKSSVSARDAWGFEDGAGI